MLQPSTTQPPDPTPEYVGHHPLLPEDPVRMGGFRADSCLAGSPMGVIYCAHADSSDPMMLIRLYDGAASNPVTRTRLSGEINAMHIDTAVAHDGQDQDKGHMAVRLRDEDDDPTATSHHPLTPRVALAFSGSPEAVAEAQRVLAVVDLVHIPRLGSPTGPDFQMHWWQNICPGAQRMWPLLWPGHKDRAGWLNLFTSFLLMLLITSVAVLLVILVSQNQQKVSPPASVPSPESATGSGSGSGSPSQSFGESSSGESPSGESSELESRSDTPSMERSLGDPSGPDSSSPERKL